MQCNSFFEINSGLHPPPRLLGPPRLLNRGSGRDPPPPVYYDPPRLFGTTEYCLGVPQTVLYHKIIREKKNISKIFFIYKMAEREAVAYLLIALILNDDDEKNIGGQSEIG